jgi:TadE-like protein
MNRADGQALIEFALVLPVLLLFAFGIVYMAEIGVARVVVEHAAAEGARVGALTNDDARIKAAVALASTPLAAEHLKTTIDPGGMELPRSRDPRGSILRVELRYVVPAPLAFGGLPSVTVRGFAARMIEWTP